MSRVKIIQFFILVCLMMAVIALSAVSCGDDDDDSTGDDDDNPVDDDDDSTGDDDDDAAIIEGIACLQPVVPIPDAFEDVIKELFDKYTYVEAPNGKPIHLFGQNNVSAAQLERACTIMSFYLTDFPDSLHGQDKTSVANQMGDVEAALVYFNTQFDSTIAQIKLEIAGINYSFQDLYATESPIEGSAEYLNHSVRDASYEEIFHLVHGHGIDQGMPDYSTQIGQAKDAAMAASIYHPAWDWDPDTIEKEYIISVIDVYYGLWAHEEGPSFGGEYDLNSRSDLQTQDTLGLAAVEAYLPPNITHQVKLSSDFDGTFTLVFDPSTSYTHKSQYLQHISLTGENDANIAGNDFDNTLKGNSGDNTLNGGAGVDTAIFTGSFSEYTISSAGNEIIVEDNGLDRDGTDTLISIEKLKFDDQILDAASLESF